MTGTERDDPLAPPAGYVHDAAAKPLADTDCDVRETGNFLLPNQTRCAKPGVLRVWFGCPREHVGFADVCSRHRIPVLAGFPAKCGNCAGAGESSRTVIIRRDETATKEERLCSARPSQRPSRPLPCWAGWR